MSILTVTLALLACAALTVHALSAATVLRPTRPSSLPARHRPPISVLKPLKGAAPDLYDNLAAFARQDYPDYELVFGAADGDDPALAVAEQIRRDFPSVPITILGGPVCAPGPGDLNPKVSNLAGLTGAARHDWILVSDADVRPGPGYLADLADFTMELDGEGADGRPVGLVASLLVGTGEKSLGAAWDALHLAGWVSPALSAAELLAGQVCVVGKSMLMPRRALDQAGGWRSVRDVLAEDYVLGRRVLGAGYRVALSRAPVRTLDRHRTVRAFLARHLRWAQMRCRIAPVAYAAEPLLNPVPLILAWLVSEAFAPLALAGAACGLKVALDALLTRRLRGSWPALRHLATVPLKDLAILFVWVTALFRRTIVWRGTRMVIGHGSRLRPLTSAPSATSAHEPARESGGDPDWGEALSETGRAA